ncbi:hypothetical protein E3T43_04835 [Cryobacterium sp. Hh7]|uniref:hypothetical protein n=1 Tax=Cryobacterium sp. Hh7 TaxID=1259159 RepID=UPI00106D97D3|nr:hypothetical protein [Cryobacterium sp. Hh7]TFD59424.1 hypothetical protein E3T43_04835 [Cryobacterium sp. Hh7]
MRQRSLFTVIAAAALLSLTLAGCSSEKAAAKLDPAESPLSKYMSGAYGDYDEDSMLAQQNEQEELVATCMADEGFDYLPVDNSQYSGMMSDSGDQNTEKWVAENGYGMSQSPEQLAEQQEQSEEFVDPNQDYVMSLSEGEQAAYYEVLYGVQPTEEEMGEDGSYEYTWETSGCQGFASHEITGDQPSQEDHAALYEAMSALYEDAQKSPELVALDAEWATCMADAGYADFTKKAEAVDSIMNAQNALYEEGSETGPDEKALADMREKELALAMVDFTCSEDLDYTDASMKVQFDLEEQFIIDHKSELDALIADYEQGK